MKLCAVMIALAACGGSPAPGPASPPAAAPAANPQSDVLAQAALAEQYDLGKRVYVDRKCNTCHGDHGEGNPKNPAVIGPGAYPEQAPPAAKLRRGIAFRSAHDVLAFVKAKMPIKSPGTLSDADAAAVTSWMLSETKVAIDRPLTADNAATVTLAR